MKKQLLIMAILTAVTLVPALADNPLNGTPKRPFYIVGHNPDNDTNVKNDIDSGANALEPDVSVPCYSCVCDHNALNPTNLITADTDGGVYDCDTEHLIPWLVNLHSQVMRARTNAAGSDHNFTNLCLLTFDCKDKSSAANNSVTGTTGAGLVVLKAIRDFLNTPDMQPPLWIMINCKDSSQVPSFFAGVNQNSTDPYYRLNPWEGLMCDGTPLVSDVEKAFRNSLNFTGNVGYAAGSSAPGALYGPSLPKRIDMAVAHRALYGGHGPQSVPYAYLISSREEQNYYMDAGADGIITDSDSDKAAQNITQLKGELANRSDLRYARISDNPFVTAPPAYVLQVYTGTDSGAGTDATLDFTLHGDAGSATITVDTVGHTSYGYDDSGSRMENGDTDYVTIYSVNIGNLSSLTVRNHGDYLGPDWEIHTIKVFSALHFQATNDSSVFYQTTHGGWVNSGDNITFPLAPHDISYSEQWVNPVYPWGRSGYVGSYFNPRPNFLSAYTNLVDSGVAHLAAGNYHETNRLDLPVRLEVEPANGVLYPAGNVRLSHP